LDHRYTGSINVRESGNVQAKPVQKTIGGVTFEDRFAHLQDDTAEALDWQWQRDALTRQAAEASPNYTTIRDRMLQLDATDGAFTPRKRGGLWFVIGSADGDPVVRVSDAPDSAGRIVVSARSIADGIGASKVMIGRIEASPKGRFFAIAWGADGDMIGQWSVYDTANGRHLADAGGIIHTGARPGWLPDESGFWLNDRTAEGFHQLRFIPVIEGTAERPAVPLPVALVGTTHSGLTLQIAPGGRRGVLVTEPHEHVALVHLDLDTLETTPFLPSGFDGECDGSWIDDDTYVARVNNGVPRGRVVAIPVTTSRDLSTWRELIGEGEGFIGWAGTVGEKLYVGDLVDVSLRIRVFALDGTLIETLPLESPGSSPSLRSDRSVRPTDALAFSHATFTRSSVLFVHDPDTGTLSQIGEPKQRLAGVVAEQRFATSRDGTRIPYFIVRLQDLDRDRPQPALVHAYGGFNISILPSFPTTAVPFIEAGGIYVQASLRGGAEYGKAWHDGGRLFNKRNTFDDLQAVAEALIADGVSAPDRLAFHGGSNGGLLAGAAIVFQPDLWRVVVPQVPIFDIMEMLPLTPETAVVRAIMYEDYGDPTEPEVARSVMTWSPYHNVKDGTVFPAVYQIFGEQDLGCMPFHGRKFTARLDEANSGDRPIHLRVWRNTGHSVTDPVQSAAYYAEWLSFVMDQTGLTAAGA